MAVWEAENGSWINKFTGRGETIWGQNAEVGIKAALCGTPRKHVIPN